MTRVGRHAAGTWAAAVDPEGGPLTAALGMGTLGLYALCHAQNKWKQASRQGYSACDTDCCACNEDEMSFGEALEMADEERLGRSAEQAARQELESWDALEMKKRGTSTKAGPSRQHL